jgi:hypothetical protein
MYSRIRVAATLAAVDHVEVFEREAELAGEGLYAVAQLAIRKWGELVEQRLD